MGKIKISDMDRSTTLKGFSTIGTDANNQSVQVSLEFVGEEADRAKTNADAAAAATTKAETATTNANAATAAAKTATANAETATGKANTATTNANAATDRLTTLCDNRDKVVDGYWWHYNESTKAYENTGEIAKGNVMYATFEVTDAGRLLMHTDEEYTGANFKLDTQGVLSVII